jgi:quercetin dioxygenase-like cupin family protein
MVRVACICALAAGVLVAAPAPAQPAAQGEADPGVRPTRLIDRAEIRVSRVEIQPGATRRVHAHDDVEYHVWVPLEGTLQVTVGSDAPVTARAGQAIFMKRGTPHGFKNIGATPGAVMEIFVKSSTAPADVAAWLGLARTSGRRTVDDGAGTR